MSKDRDRREFLGDLLKLPCATLLFGTIGPLQGAEPAESGDEEYDPKKHYYAMGIQIDKCIGCGRCMNACKIENNVPKEPFF